MEKRLGTYKEMAQSKLQLVIITALFCHYKEKHWAPMAELFGQMGKVATCGVFPSLNHATECMEQPSVSISPAFDGVVNESPKSAGTSGSSTPASLPSLESQSNTSEYSFQSFIGRTNILLQLDSIALVVQHYIHLMVRVAGNLFICVQAGDLQLYLKSLWGDLTNPLLLTIR